MMQGDAYDLPIEIVVVDGPAVTPEDVKDVEIVIGSLRKTFVAGEVKFDRTTNEWLFPLSQEETFKFLPTKIRGQVRLHWKTGEIEGYKLDTIDVDESTSKEVL